MKKTAIILVILVLLIWVGLSFFKKKLTPFEKMAHDIINKPNSPAGKAQRDYLKTVGGDTNSYDWLISFVDYRKSNPSDAWAIAYNRKKQWSIDEVVNL